MNRYEIKVLIVEDKKDHIQVLEDTIEEFNESNENYLIKYKTSSTYEDSLSILLEDDFDVAIIDLSLSNTRLSGETLEGNKLINIITKKLRIPIIVRSGHPEDAKPDDLNDDNEFYKVYSKSEDASEILNQIKTWIESGLSQALKASGPIEEYLQNIFWVHFSENFNQWNSIEDKSTQQKSLLRYTFYLLQEYLGINGEDGSFEPFHSAEFYIYPPVRNNLFFGDILSHNDEYYFILTPACEMAQEKYSKVLLAKITNFEDVSGFSSTKQQFFDAMKQYTDSEMDVPKKVTKSRDELARWFRNGHSNSLGYHFIPPYSDFPGGFIDFQQLVSISPDDFPYQKILTVSSQFSKDVSSRFSLYYARQGQPNLNPDTIINILSS
ncbi:hypothetical protein [Exiguobacterium sp. UBA3968]|uniref:hypothetical protein n=1 Tax=Exiguobacterium sp. UBA3968 TaxID=1946492 RepID=UPI0025B9D1F3|nr:hypothetical protein [Exiguobacterium sp. UBA3968]